MTNKLCYIDFYLDAALTQIFAPKMVKTEPRKVNFALSDFFSVKLTFFEITFAFNTILGLSQKINSFDEIVC